MRAKEILKRFAARGGHLIYMLEGSPASSVGDIGQVATWKWANQARNEIGFRRYLGDGGVCQGEGGVESDWVLAWVTGGWWVFL